MYHFLLQTSNRYFQITHSLTSVINAENASMKAKKLASMARRTREQLLKTFCETLCTSTTLVPSQKKGGNPGKSHMLSASIVSVIASVIILDVINFNSFSLLFS